MFQERDGEKEILLGNKQLLGIFFVLAILFGVFFTAGYMVGRTTGDKKPGDTAVEARSVPADNAQASGGETHSVSPEPTSSSSDQPSTRQQGKPSPAAAHTTASGSKQTGEPASSDSAEAKPATKPKLAPTRSQEEREPGDASSYTAPASHNTYLQVAALHRADAETVAKVLAKKGFQARISPKAGTPFYRVLVGPVRDAGELNSTRDALKNKGFREVFVQHL
jgi:cell division protein FtsN